MARPNDDTPACRLHMSVDGKDWRDVTPPLRSVDVEDHDRLTDKATIVFDDPGGALAHASFEGLTVRVALGWGDRTATIFEGVIAGHRVIATQDTQWLELTALDFTFRMTGHTPDPPRVWDSGERLSDVVRTLVTRPEYRIVAAQIEPTDDRRFDKKSPLRQANVNDWEFVLDLARRQNCLTFVEFDGHDESRFSFVPLAKVVAAQPIGELRYLRGGPLLEFDYERINSAAPPLRQESTVDPVSGRLVVEPVAALEPRPALPPPAAAHLDPPQRRALVSLTELAAVAETRLTRPTERVAGAAADPAAVAARVVPDPTRRLGFSGHGVATGNVELRAKSMVTIKGVASWAEGDWYVTKANHVFTRAPGGTGRARPGYYTKFTATR
ncbi:hypothetical protein [Streptomyces melanogenes]|uniref:hypothetical protein n=1 Tax=Streptomyces melanogenes TaxID=67326 RepID=UPI0037A75339